MTVLKVVGSIFLISIITVGLLMLWIRPHRAAEHRRVGAFYKAYRAKKNEP